MRICGLFIIRNLLFLIHFLRVDKKYYRGYLYNTEYKEPREGFLNRITLNYAELHAELRRKYSALFRGKDCEAIAKFRVVPRFMLNRIVKFLKEVRQELKKVSWPSRQETTKYTLIVIGVSVAVAAFLGSLDFLFAWTLEKFIIH